MGSGANPLSIILFCVIVNKVEGFPSEHESSHLIFNTEWAVRKNSAIANINNGMDGMDGLMADERTDKI